MLINSPTPSTFSCWKIRFKTQASSCPGFPSEAMLWVKAVEMVDSVDDLKSPRSIQGYTHFTIFTMLDARIASALKKIIQNSYFKKKVSAESPERRSVPSRKTDRLHDLRLLPDYWPSWYRSWLPWFFLNHSSQRRRSGIRYEMGFLLPMTKIPTWWCPGKFVQVENTWVWSTQNLVRIVRHGNSSEKYRYLTIKSWKRWWREAKIRNFDYEIFTPEMRRLRQVQWLRVAGD